MIEFKLPSLGADMDEGRLLEWKIAPGQAVKRGDIVAVVDTSKAAVEIESWQEGTLFELLVEPGEKIPVGTVMATLLTAGESADTAPRHARPAVPAHMPATPGLRKPASPAARKRARELDIDVEQVAGTGPHGAVTIEDVDKAAAASAMPPDRKAEMRKAIGAAMARSKREIPHYYLAESITMHNALEWLARQNAARPVTERVLAGALQLKAVALALRELPQLNGFWRGGAFVPGPGIHIGVAISIRQGGLIAPALHDADRKTIPELMAALTDLVQRARAGSLKSSEMSDPTVTVTNLGEQGVESVFGIIYPPQVALVGFGRIVERPWAEGGAVRVMPVVTATLSGDHRVTDGHTGARFLAALREFLQKPEEL
jgi:pyruvate dehydrogenase E2 component (dihydrolipoamide acetyltransferase)